MSRGRNLWGIFISACILVALLAAGYYAYRYWREHRFDPLIAKAAEKHGLSPFLVKAVVWRESWFDPDCHGPVDEIGLMQVRPSTAQEWAKQHKLPSLDPSALFIPAVNLDIGCWYLRRALDRWQHTTAPVPFALAEYNAGRGNVLRWAPKSQTPDAKVFIASITYPGTRRYVLTIQERFRSYAARGRL